jgi:hypothetical protein
MYTTTTSAYRVLVARAIVGEALTLLPASLKLGTGRYNAGTGVLTPPSPDDLDLATPTITGIAVTVTRSGQLLRCTATRVGTNPAQEITEAGLFLGDGTCVLLDSFRPRTLQSGVTFILRYTLMPEVS